MFPNILKVVKRAILYFFAITILWVLIYRFVNPPVTWLMLQRGFERKANDKAWKIDKEWRDFDELSNNLKCAAISGEDAGFMNHWGFDANAIQKAYLKNKEGKPMRGGSTISQQTAKNVFLWPGRSWIRKGFEAYFTILIEIFWSKERILEVYLNVIEMGDGIYGAEAATQAYYNKPSQKLTKRQAALLIAVLPNPRKWNPTHPTPYIRYKAALIRKNMRILQKTLKFD
ncbi:monofunctional biosynthetic peptidoglycan transglycosylase [Arcticibacter sp. MXS-1]|uniref:monofunctional biosynthetic peptidoglycan transglycosylase n=1 Tax=Arcticibacter sp. MXS-1 TaxID=3341726 RepID=UPI0035A84D32